MKTKVTRKDMLKIFEQFLRDNRSLTAYRAQLKQSRIISWHKSLNKILAFEPNLWLVDPKLLIWSNNPKPYNREWAELSSMWDDVLNRFGLSAF